MAGRFLILVPSAKESAGKILTSEDGESYEGELWVEEP